MGKQDFSKSIIYHFRNKETKVVIYVGSTTCFKGRRNQYKCHYHNPKYPQYLSPLNKYIRANGGWDAYEMVAIQSLNLKSKEELFVAEQAEIDNHTTLLNCNDAVRNNEKQREGLLKRMREWKKIPTAVKEKAKRDKNIESIMALCSTIDLADDTLDKIKELLELKAHPYTEDKPNRIKKEKKQKVIKKPKPIKEPKAVKEKAVKVKVVKPKEPKTVQANNKTGVNGISLIQKTKKYKAQHKGCYIGYYQTIEEAVEALEIAKKEPKTKKPKAEKIAGVCFCKNANKYKVQYKGKHIGYYETVDEAKTAYEHKKADLI